MCEPDCIKYTKGANFTCTDIERSRAFADRTYKSAVELFAHLCAKFSQSSREGGYNSVITRVLLLV